MTDLLTRLGYHTAGPLDARTFTCPKCRGASADASRTCQTCSGEGAVTEADAGKFAALLALTHPFVCLECHGIGRDEHRDECWFCGGLGALTPAQWEAWEATKPPAFVVARPARRYWLLWPVGLCVVVVLVLLWIGGRQ